MAAINCPDCNGMVSALAEKCPHCARPHPAKSMEQLAHAAKAEEKSAVEAGEAIAGLLWFGHAFIVWVKLGFGYAIGSLFIGPLIWLFR